MECNDEGDISDISSNEMHNDETHVTSKSNHGQKRGRKNFLTARLLAALDNAKVSDGMAVHILIAAGEAFGLRVEELAINRSTIHRLRQENRLRESEEISANFTDNVNCDFQPELVFDIVTIFSSFIGE